MGKFFNWGCRDFFGSAIESAAKVAIMDTRKAIEDAYKAIEEMKNIKVISSFNDLLDVKNSEIRIDGNKLIFERKKTEDGETIVEYKLELEAGRLKLEYSDGGDNYANVEITPRRIYMDNSNDRYIEITPEIIIHNNESKLVIEELLEEIKSLKDRVDELEGNNA